MDMYFNEVESFYSRPTVLYDLTLQRLLQDYSLISLWLRLGFVLKELNVFCYCNSCDQRLFLSCGIESS